MFLSCDSFEKFFGGTFGVDREAYVGRYRNDFSWDYSAGLISRGHDVFLYILARARLSYGRHQPEQKIHVLNLPRWQRLPDSLLYQMMNAPPASLLRELLAHCGYARQLKEALVEDNIDVLYVQELWAPRLHVILHDSLPLPVIGADHGAAFDPRLYRRLKNSVPRAFKLTCQTLENLERVKAIGGDGVLLPNGVDTNFFAPPVACKERPKSILAVGRLVEEQKRFSDLLRALPLLSEFNVLIAGHGPDAEALRQIARKMGVADRVRFLGFVSDRAELLDQLYQDCGVFCLDLGERRR